MASSRGRTLWRLLRVRKGFLIALAVVVVGAVTVVMVLDPSIPPSSRSAHNMVVCAREVLRFARRNDRLPASLAEIEAAGVPTKDFWGRDFLYTVRDGTVKLVSLGRDGRRGGAGKDADLVMEFACRLPDGSWAQEAGLVRVR